MSKKNILIKNGLLLDPRTRLEARRDVRVSGELITDIDKNLNAHSDDQIIDGQDLWICPGFIDIHTHLRDLGQKDKEDIITGTAAAAAGGYTTVVAMANTVPVVDNTSTMSVLLQRIREHALIEVLPLAAVTMGLEGAELTSMSDLANMGAVAFSDDGMTVSNLAVLRRALEYAKLTGKVIISHPEDRDLSAGGCIQEGRRATCLGLAGIPSESETAAVAREIEVVRGAKAPYHFTHLSCARSVELVRQAKEDGLLVSADVTPHHLTLHVDDIPGYDTNYKMKPPLRTAADIQALVEGLQDGTIDAIATDHAPHSRLEKQTTMDDSAVGILGLETAFSLCYEKLVTKGPLQKLDLIRLFTSGPAAVLDLQSGGLEVGSTANITLVDPARKWIYDSSRGASKSHNSPYSGHTLTGKVVMTIYRGKVVYKHETASAGAAGS
jgi:dihydroorotase